MLLSFSKVYLLVSVIRVKKVVLSILFNPIIKKMSLAGLSVMQVHLLKENIELLIVYTWHFTITTKFRKAHLKNLICVIYICTKVYR